MYNRPALKLIYTYDGSFEGLLSAIYRAYYDRQIPDEILCEHGLQRELLCRYVPVVTDSKNANAVYMSIPKKISKGALKTVYLVHLSEEPDKGTVIYNYLRLGFELGKKVDLHMDNDWVMRALKISWYVSREAHRLTGFLRFSQMEGGIYYAPITPVNDVLELLCRHFAERLAAQPWVICDTGRKKAAVYDTKKWEILSVDSITLPDLAEKEKEYQRLWREFYNTIGIESRRNEKLRQKLMPKMYHKNMTEFQLDDL